MHVASILCALLLQFAAVPGPPSRAPSDAPAGTTASKNIDPKKARKILDHVDDLYRGKSSRGAMAMTVVTEHWERTLKMTFWSRGKEHSLVRILSPKKEQGISTLRVENNIWNYLPKVSRIIKVPSSMMSSAWMGSHFTHDDMVKESRMADDYDFELVFEGDRYGKKMLEVRCTPKANAAVVWGEVRVEVEQDSYMPHTIRYYDEDLRLSRTMTFHDIKTFGRRRVPARMRIVPENDPGEYTEVVYDDVIFDVALPQDLFSLRRLQAS